MAKETKYLATIVPVDSKNVDGKPRLQHPNSALRIVPPEVDIRVKLTVNFCTL